MIVSHSQRIKEIAALVLWLEASEFKSIVQMETDPVCGMVVEQESVRAQAQYRVHTFYFCAVGCRNEFLAVPEPCLVIRPQL